MSQLHYHCLECKQSLTPQALKQLPMLGCPACGSRDGKVKILKISTQEIRERDGMLVNENENEHVHVRVYEHVRVHGKESMRA